jgi:hypothetical protein
MLTPLYLLAVLAVAQDFELKEEPGISNVQAIVERSAAGPGYWVPNSVKSYLAQGQLPRRPTSFGTYPEYICLLAPFADMLQDSKNPGMIKRYLEHVEFIAYDVARINHNLHPVCNTTAEPRGQRHDINERFYNLCIKANQHTAVNAPKRYTSSIEVIGPSKYRSVETIEPSKVIAQSLSKFVEAENNDENTLKALKIMRLLDLQENDFLDEAPSSDLEINSQPKGFPRVAAKVFMDRSRSAEVRSSALMTVAVLNPSVITGGAMFRRFLLDGDERARSTALESFGFVVQNIPGAIKRNLATIPVPDPTDPTRISPTSAICQIHPYYVTGKGNQFAADDERKRSGKSSTVVTALDASAVCAYPSFRSLIPPQFLVLKDEDQDAAITRYCESLKQQK